MEQEEMKKLEISLQKFWIIWGKIFRKIVRPRTILAADKQWKTIFL